MRKHIYVRPVRPEDRELFIKWTTETPKNLADPNVVGYPTTFVLCAYDDQGPLVFMPVQQPLFLEALAIRPGADPIAVAGALRDLIKACVTQAYLKGSGEIYFLCDEESTQRFAEHQLFTKLPYNLYRVKLSDLEKES